jgi:hypothetical protein
MNTMEDTLRTVTTMREAVQSRLFAHKDLVRLQQAFACMKSDSPPPGRDISFGLTNGAHAVYYVEDDARIAFRHVENNAHFFQFACVTVNCAACGLLMIKGLSKKCSQCHIPHYCSVDCQKDHWKRGGHLKWCEDGNACRTSANDGRPETYSVKCAGLKAQARAEVKRVKESLDVE